MSNDQFHCFGFVQVLMEERWGLMEVQSPDLESELNIERKLACVVTVAEAE